MASAVFKLSKSPLPKFLQGKESGIMYIRVRDKLGGSLQIPYSPEPFSVSEDHQIRQLKADPRFVLVSETT